MDEEMIVVGDPLPRIGSVEPLGGFRVRVTWRDGSRAGETEDIDLAPAIFNHRHFVPLRSDAGLFRQVSVEHWGSALAWPRGIELSAEWIGRLPRRDMTNVEFRQAMDDLRMTLDGMSATLGIARRTIAEYRKDKPIPPYVALAVRQLMREGVRPEAAS